MKKVESLGLSQEVTRESLIKNKHNKYTSTYLLLLKKYKNEEFSEAFNQKVPQPPVNTRGESHSINPRIKKIFEYKDSEKIEEKDSMDSAYQPRMREMHYIKTTPRRKIYCTEREARAASTGYNGSRNVPKEPVQPKPTNRRNFRPANVRTPVSYNETAGSFNVSIKNKSPRAGTALNVTKRNEQRYVSLN